MSPERKGELRRLVGAYVRESRISGDTAIAFDNIVEFVDNAVVEAARGSMDKMAVSNYKGERPSVPMRIPLVSRGKW